MSKSLHLLNVEDSEVDAQLLVRLLREGGYDVVFERVQTAEAMRAALDHKPWDIIISDYKMPAFDGFSALQLARERVPDIPFILVTGAVGEERAAAIIRAGANDFLLKGKLERLASVVERVLREAEEHYARKCAEEALRQSEKLYRLLADNVENFITFLDTQENRLYVSPAFYRVTGWTAEEVMSSAWDARLHPDDLPLIRQSRAANLAGQTTLTEHRILCRDGSWIWVESRCKPLPGPDGRVAKLLIHQREITKRRQALEALSGSERLLRQVMDLVPHYIFAKDRHGRFLLVNRASAEVFGRCPEDVVGRYELELSRNKAHAEAFLRDDREVIDSGKPKFISEEPTTDANGQVHFLQTTKIPFTPPGSAEKGVMGVAVDITERKRALEALRQSQERYQALADNSLLGIAVMDANYRIMTVNATFAGLFRKPAADFVGKFCFNEFEKRSAVCPHCPGTRAMASRSTAEVETQGVRDDGSRFCVRNRAVPVFGPDGAVSGFIEIVEDIDKQVRAEQALRESEEKFRSYIENAPVAVLVSTLEGRFTDCNPAAVALFGYDAATLKQMRAEVLYPEEDRETVMQEMESLARTGHVEGEFRMKRRDGRIIWVSLSVNSIGSGRALGFCQDITERKQTEEKRARLEMAVEQAEETILITDASGTILYANPAFERSSGYSREEVIGQNPRILKSGKQDAGFYQRMWTVLGRGEVWKGRFTNKKKDDTLHEEEATISPIRNAAGKIINYVAIKLDVTREVAMEAQLRQAQKLDAIGTLAGGVAHEINNPVNGIMNYAQLIADELQAGSPLRKYVDKIMKEAGRVAKIAGSLLTFARQATGGRSPANMNDIINATLSLIQTVIRQDQITLDVEVPEGLPQMECRSQQIEQVLMNLLTNARDALNEKYPGYHENKIVRLTVRRFEKDGKPWVRTTVEDHGNGIPAGVRDRVFDPFYTTKRAGKGTGLGLSISHGIVKEHHGELRFETETGRFTRFHLDLPVND